MSSDGSTKVSAPSELAEELITEIMEYADPEGGKADRLLLRAAAALDALQKRVDDWREQAGKDAAAAGELRWRVKELEQLSGQQAATIRAFEAATMASWKALRAAGITPDDETFTVTAGIEELAKRVGAAAHG